MRQHVERPAYQPRPSFAELAHAAVALGGIDVGAGRVLEHRVVRAGAKGSSFPGHDQHAAIAIVADGLQLTLEIEDDSFIEAIATLGAIERDRRDRAVFLDEEILCHLVGSLRVAYFGATLRCNSLTFSLFHCFTFLPACAPATDVEQSLFSVSRAERWPSGRRHQIANLAYWVTGTEGSNPSLSATQSGMFAYFLEKR